MSCSRLASKAASVQLSLRLSFGVRGGGGWKLGGEVSGLRVGSVLALIDLGWLRHSKHEDVDGRLNCTGDPACKRIMARRESVGQSWVSPRFRGGLVFKAHRLAYHSTLGLIVIKKKGVTKRSDWSRSDSRLAFATLRGGKLSQALAGS